ncbi:MAG: ribosome-binding factor A [Candidatus Portnoybacteria bacterium RBG_19FT_COMBO_36_7]|uniref:Ribosome-binding factor A n=1 Tax=Candidatus Portnoybacteria bacterium RBG_19FT_COMBO_36_7 TaxID=1801992 RepID=A0A1G2F6W5_9BACT|nr:MAG: ribosome-binding factor A [Candidatus Portnoybacteria bacterium RBG_19FT_COMBO_36_7]
MPHRIERLNELIRQVLGRIILQEEDFGPAVLVTIMKVETSDDVLHSNVFLSVYPTEKGEGVLKRLNRHVFDLQQLMNKKLEMRPVPKIRFVLDKTEAEAQELDELMEK